MCVYHIYGLFQIIFLENVDQKLGLKKPPPPLVGTTSWLFLKIRNEGLIKGCMKKVLLLLRAMCLYFTLLMRRQEVRKWFWETLTNQFWNNAAAEKWQISAAAKWHPADMCARWDWEKWGFLETVFPRPALCTVCTIAKCILRFPGGPALAN